MVDKHTALFSLKMRRFNDGIQMPIPFLNKINVKGLKQNPYNISMKDRKAMDDILNLLKRDDHIKDIPLSQLSAAASPVFII